ncbi:Platinum sensitivity protein [Linnemannia gamsii]|uniref:Platinum sensitivity protein n=1 Tax=Linnemannia gamsii TaxID=64522 RepID=A0ABQ7JSN8_9FUNG|nr:Platinum sensitivity protein [Linnemannia gamsii]
MRVHSSTNDDRVLDSIKQKTDDSVLPLTEDHAELGLKLQEPDGYSSGWNALNDFPQEYYVDGAFTLPADELSTSSLLPNPSITNLKEIEAILGAMGTDEEQQLKSFILTECYIDKLVSVFKACEEESLTFSLHTLRAILVHLIQLGEHVIIGEVIKDETFEGCIGIMEYEPDLMDEKSHYRLTYSQRGNFKEVVPFNDEQIAIWVHQVFRLQFVKDIALIRYLEEVPKAILGAMIQHRNYEIIQNLLSDRKFLTELFELIKDTSASLDRRQDVVHFMHQFCSMAKKTGLNFYYRRLYQLGLFSLFEFAFASDCIRVKQAGIDILLMTLENSPGSIRTHIVEQAKDKSSKTFFDGVINQYLTENDANLMTLLTEVIRVLMDIDPESADENGFGSLGGSPFSVVNSSRLDPDADQFLDLFYAQYCSTLVTPVLQLMKTAIKFFRACLSLEDDYFNRILIKNKAIHGVVEMLLDTNGKNDLLNSVCLEFFSFIRDKNNKLLVSHCATVHRKALEEISYTTIFKNLLALHDDGDINSGGGDGMSGSSSKILWGSQSRLFPGMRVPLFPGSGNDDKTDLGAVSYFPNPVPLMMEGPELEDVEMPDTTVAEETSLNEKPEEADGKLGQSDEHNLTTSGSSPPLLPLPSVALRSEIAFLKTGENRDGNDEQVADIASNATRLKSELATGSSNSEAETRIVSKRKRGDEGDSDLDDADARAQPRLKLDGIVPETTEQPLASERDHSPLVDNSDTLSDHGDTFDSNSAAASGDSSAVPDDHSTALTADSNITDGQSNTNNN